MVLGFGTRSTRKKGARPAGAPTLRASPSLPELAAQGIPWPADLVDVAAIRATPPPDHPAQGPAKTSLPSSSPTAIPFHKPFRVSTDTNGGSIHALYTSHPPTAFLRTSSMSTPQPRPSHRVRARTAPTFNIMVAGAKKTGKTSLLRLLVDTSDVAPAAPPAQRAALARVLPRAGTPTARIDTASVEIWAPVPTPAFDRVLLSVIDTPGLDFRDGRELRLDRQVSGLVKYLDLQYADTMDEESKVVRRSKGDQHVHLCIYLIDPDSLQKPPPAEPSTPSAPKSAIKVRDSISNPNDNSNSNEADTDDEDEDEERLVMSRADLRVLARLAARVNVLPVLARADTLTDERLRRAKAAVRRDLTAAGLGFGVFGPSADPDADVGKAKEGKVQLNGAVNGNGHAHFTKNDAQDGDEDIPDEDEEDEVRPTRPVVKLRPSRALTPARVRSRSLLSAATAPLPPAGTGLAELLPFALVMPEPGPAPPPATPAPATPGATPTPSRRASRVSADDGAGGPARDLRGVFVRRFRWGAADVLDPAHCDFAVLRRAVLGSHLPALKARTREVLYEKFRTEKLFARRATRSISAEETRRLLQDLGL